MRAGIWLCAAGGAFGAAGLLGWIIDWPFLTTVFPNQPSMMPNTALALLLTSAAAMLRSPETRRRLPRMVSAALAVVVLAIAGGTLIEYAAPVDLGIDGLLLHLFERVGEGPSPGRPSPPTAFALTLLASAVLLLDFRRYAQARPSEWLILGALFTAFVALVGFLYGAGPLYRLSDAPVKGVAVPTAAGLALLSIGLLLVRPDAGVMRLVTSRGPGGIMVRRLAIAALLACIVLGPAVTGLLERFGVADPALVLAVLSIAMTAVTLVLLAATTPALNRAHEALEASRKNFSDLIEHAPDAIFVADAQDRYTDVNSAACRLLGIERSEIVGKRIADVLPPDDVERFAQVRKELLRGQSPVTEWLVRRKDGSQVPVEVSARILADGRSQGFVRDISERKRADEALRQSQERLELALRGADLATWDWNVKTGEVVFNARWAELRGFRPEEIEPHVNAWIAGVHPDDWPRVEEALREHFEGRVPEYETEHRVRAKSGDWIWILDRGKVFARDEHGQPVRMVGTELDVTARKRRGRESRLLAEFAAALGSTLDYEETLSVVARVVVAELAEICLIEPARESYGGRSTLAHRDPANAAAAEALRRAPLNALVARLGGVTADTQRAFVVNAVGSQLESPAVDEEHRLALAAVGIESLLALPLLAGASSFGTILLASTTPARRFGSEDLLLAEEVARRTVLALDKARLYKNAVDATRARDELLAIVAHDLRNPLNALLLEINMLRRPGTQKERRSLVAVDAIERSARRMTRLIDDLLDITRVEAGCLFVARDRVPVTEVVTDCVRAQTPLAAARSIELALELETELPDVCGDRDRLLQVFENLIGNALKFTEPGGRITLGAARAGNEVRFWTHNTGRGIPQAQVPHVFDRFWQGPNEQRRGAGLGLAIVRGIVEAHGGRVWVESLPGRGTTFCFTVPAAPGNAIAQQRLNADRTASRDRRP